MLAGAAGWDAGVEPAVAAVPAGMTVLRPGHLPVELLPGLLGGAQVVAYPSLGEGFGLPVLEAMACGAAVLTTRKLSLPEVGGDAVAYTGTGAGDIAAALSELLDDPERRADCGRGRAAGEPSSPGRPARRRTRSPTTGPPRRRRVHDARPLTVTPDDAVGLVTVTYSPGRRSTALLDSIPAATSAARCRWCWPTTGPPTAVSRRAASRPGVQLLRTGGNLGYGGAANAGVAVLDPAIRWVVVINPDVVLGARLDRRAAGGRGRGTRTPARSAR